MFRSTALCFLIVLTTLKVPAETDSIRDLARERAADLRLSVYATAGSVVKMADSEPARGEALDAMSRLGISGIYIEVYRSGMVVPPEKLIAVRDFFRNNGVTVAGGIATVPGKDFGVAADTGLHWFNFEAPETQQALAQVMRQSAPVFDTFIVDDFLCSGDTSEISNQARGDRSWSEYRRDLMVQVSKEVLIGPAKEANPSIKMIIKYPQWYDLFHVYGYEIAREPALYDGVRVGTETRGALTQRYGFVQPYEGFVNYRWIAAQSAGKIGGAWFDHGDCGEFDFIDQAWQSVAAGAPELILFHLGDIVEGHPDHARLRQDFNALADLAAVVRDNPVVGTVAYKPPNSDAGDDLYILDLIGMLGVSVVPSPVFPSDAATIFLPTQAAADPDIAQKVDSALEAGRHIIVTPGFIAKLADPDAMARLAGLAAPMVLQPLKAETVPVGQGQVAVENGLDFASDLKVAGAEVMLEAPAGGHNVPFLTSFPVNGGRMSVLNTRTFSQADFDAAGEVLLSPRPLGLMHLPAKWADCVRTELMRESTWHFRGPVRVACQQLGRKGWLIQNYNDHAIEATMHFADDPQLQNALTGEPIVVDKPGIKINLPPRGRLWIKKTSDR
jgi:hypothetical protein